MPAATGQNRIVHVIKVLAVLLIALVSMGAEGECFDEEESAVEAEIAQTVEAAPEVTATAPETPARRWRLLPSHS